MRDGAGSPAGRRSSAGLAAPPAVDEHCRRRPAGPLRPYVAWYTGYRQRGVPPAVHRGLPSPFLTLILTLDEPLTMAAHADPRQPPGEFGTLLGGLHSRPALIAHEGAQSGIQVALRPLGARTLLGLPAGELAAIDVPADADPGGGRLGGAVRDPGRGPARRRRVGCARAWGGTAGRGGGRLGVAAAAALRRHG